jgi:hypothetical protein
MGPAERIAISIKAWNAYWDNESVKLLRWSNSREAFPSIRGLAFEEVIREQAA